MLLQFSCKSVSLLNSSSPVPVNNSTAAHFTVNAKLVRSSFSKSPNVNSLSPKTLLISQNFSFFRSSHLSFCSQNDVFDDFTSTQLPETSQDDGILETEELELLNKPSPVVVSNESVSEDDIEPKKPDKDEVLAPFLKFFKGKEPLEEGGEEGVGEEFVEEDSAKVSVAYYEPKPGDFVVGVVVSGNENKLDVNIGADMLGTMLTKEVLPLYDKEMEYLLCDFNKDAEEFMVHGKMGIVKDDDHGRWGPVTGRLVVDTGTVLFAEVLGRTLSGRPLLSTRRLFRQIAWHRVRQIKQLNEPIEVKIVEWNTGGLLTRIEGLRAFLPKAELLNRVNSFTELKENVGRKLQVKITRMDEAKNDLILSEKDAWEMLNLREGTLLEGTVKKIYPYGAQIRIGETNRSGLLHISNISRSRITSVSDLLSVDEKVKVLVVKPMFPNKISLSIADLESEPGLFISDKEKVISEAETMAKKYRQKLPTNVATRKLETPNDNALPFDDEPSMYANWKWFKFEKNDQSS